jgi:hypothetical protein
MDTNYSRVSINFSYVLSKQRGFCQVVSHDSIMLNGSLHYLYKLCGTVCNRKGGGTSVTLTLSIGDSDAFYGKKWHINLVRM